MIKTDIRETKSIVDVIQVIFGALIIFFLFFVGVGTSAKMDKVYANHIDYDININDDGSITINEYWDVSINNYSTLFINWNKYNKMGKIRDVNVKDMNTGMNLIKTDKYYETMPSGYFYALERSSNEYEIAWGTGTKGKSGQRKYLITYTVEDSIKEYNDCQEFYWMLLNSDNGMQIEKLTGSINIPNSIKNKENLKVWGHGPIQGVVEIIDNNKIIFHVDNVDKNQMVEIRIASKEKIVANVSETSKNNKNYYQTIYNQEWQNQEETDTNITKIKTVIYIVIGVYSIIVVANIIQLIKKSKERFELTNNGGKYFRDIPRENTVTPAQATIMKYIANYANMESYQSEMLSAIILDLALKKHIKLSFSDEKIYIDILTDGKSLPKDEYLVFKMLNKCKGNSTLIEMKDVIKYAKENSREYTKTIEKIVSIAKDTLIKEKLVDKVKAEAVERTNNREYADDNIVSMIAKGFLRTTIFIIIMIVLLNLPVFKITLSEMFYMSFKYQACEILGLCGIFTMILHIKYKCTNKFVGRSDVLTESGMIEQAKWIGLENYLKDFSLIDEKKTQDIVLWGKYLVYATALGISEEVEKQLKTLNIQMLSENATLELYDLTFIREVIYRTSDVDNNMAPIKIMRDITNSVYKTALVEIMKYETRTTSSGYSSGSSGGFGGGGGFSSGGGGGTGGSSRGGR